MIAPFVVFVYFSGRGFESSSNASYSEPASVRPYTIPIASSLTSNLKSAMNESRIPRLTVPLTYFSTRGASFEMKLRRA